MDTKLLNKYLDVWPPTKPNVPPFMHGWCGPDNINILSLLIKKHEPTTIFELGSWYGLSARYIARHMGKKSLLYCIDMWDTQFIKDMWKRRGKNYRKYVPFIDAHPLFETFMTNLWEERHHLIPVRGNSNQCLKQLCDDGVYPDLIYIDAGHEYNNVYNDLVFIYNNFPNSVLCGDDWTWPGVKKAVQDYYSKYLDNSTTELVVEGNCWYFERKLE